jgi:hypothetical protein
MDEITTEGTEYTEEEKKRRREEEKKRRREEEKKRRREEEKKRRREEEKKRRREGVIFEKPEYRLYFLRYDLDISKSVG